MPIFENQRNIPVPTDTPLVSIIIPTFNRAHLIGETLDSVIAQTYKNWECIVVDDGSTDDTDKLLAKYIAQDSRFQYHHRPKDRLPGGNAARNYGFELSKGDYIQWFDSDDIMLPDFILKKQAEFTSKTELVICTGYSVGEHLENRQLKEMPVIDNLFKEYMMWNSRIMLPSILFKKTFLDNRQLFDETLNCAQESEFFPRVFFGIKAEQYKLLNEGLYLYRQHSKTKSTVKNSHKGNYLKSLGIVSLSNLELGIASRDIEIINHIYKSSIHYLFIAVNNKERVVAWFFLIKLIKAMRKLNARFALSLGLTFPFFILSGRSIFFIEKRIKNKIFN